MILNWIKKPYFFNSSPKTHCFLGLGLGFFIYFFLIIFQPFGFRKLNLNIYYYSAGFGLISFIIHFFYFSIIPRFFKDIFKNETWNVGKNILFLFIVFSSISIGNLYYSILFRGEFNSKPILDIFFNIAITSIFPISILTFFLENKYRSERENTSKEIMKLKISLPKEKTEKEVKIYSENKKENISFNINELIYISSKGNYTSIFLNFNNTVKERVIRTTLTNVIDNLEDFDTVIRCHKSYIINSTFMNSISGNARGYFLESNLLSIQIPISRSYKKEELKNLIR